MAHARFWRAGPSFSWACVDVLKETLWTIRCLGNCLTGRASFCLRRKENGGGKWLTGWFKEKCIIIFLFSSSFSTTHMELKRIDVGKPFFFFCYFNWRTSCVPCLTFVPSKQMFFYPPPPQKALKRVLLMNQHFLVAYNLKIIELPLFPRIFNRFFFSF